MDLLADHRHQTGAGAPWEAATPNAPAATPAAAMARADQPDDSTAATVPSQDLEAADPLRVLLDTNLLNRVRYLLEVARIEGTAVPLLRLLVRCARHSVELAEAVAECPRLLHTLQKVMLLPAAAHAEESGGGGVVEALTSGAQRERQCVQVTDSLALRVGVGVGAKHEGSFTDESPRSQLDTPGEKA
jgi:hypothetical protein